MNASQKEQLLEAARQVRIHAHAPYSNFKVGAAVLAGSGKIYAGVNVENASFPAGVCAECVAVASAVTAGEGKIDAVCVVTDMENPAAPCGVCRQVLAEFGPDMDVILASSNPDSPLVTTSMASLLPGHFNGDAL